MLLNETHNKKFFPPISDFSGSSQFFQ